MREDERTLLKAMAAGRPLREVAHDCRVPLRRVSYLVSKWSRKGWYDYGVSEDLGWLTDEGRRTADAC